MPLPSLREPPLIAKGQVGFIQYLVRPLYADYSAFWGFTKGNAKAPWLGHLDQNSQHWQQIADKAAAEVAAAAAAAPAPAPEAAAAPAP